MKTNPIQICAVLSFDDLEFNSGSVSNLLESGKGVVDEWFVSLRESNQVDEIRSLFHSLGFPNSQVHLFEVPRCGISRARNTALSAILSNTTQEASTWVVFPDDDAFFSPNTKLRIKVAQDSSKAKFLVFPYAPDEKNVNRERWPEEESLLSFATALSMVSSAGLAIRADVLLEIGPFDERLGIGTNVFGGEDTEIALRYLKNDGEISYFPQPILLHEYGSPRINRRLGSIAIHAMYNKDLSLFSAARSVLGIFKLRASFLEKLKVIYKAPLVYISFLGKRILKGQGKVSIEGIQVSSGSPQWNIQNLISMLGKDNAPIKVFGAHVTTLNASSSKEFLRAFNECQFAFVDGISISFMARLFGFHLQKKATTDYAPEIIVRWQEILGRPLRLGVVGGEPGIAQLAGEELESRFNVKICFVQDGFSKPVSLAIQHACESNIDLLILGLGMPLEALALLRSANPNLPKLTITCGGWLRLLAGTEKRSPMVMQKMQLEWAWRLVTNPKRTLKRYLQGVFVIFTAAGRNALVKLRSRCR